MSEKLLPCPFCGSENIEWHLVRECYACYDCEAEGPGPDKRRPAEAWNLRATRPTPPDLREAEALRKALATAKTGVEQIQGYVEAGGANESLTAATVVCSQVTAYIDRALATLNPKEQKANG